MPDAPLNASDYMQQISSVSTEADLNTIELELFSRKHGIVTLALKQLGELSDEVKRKKGPELNDAKRALTDAIAKKRNELRGAGIASLAQTDRLDMTLDLPLQPRIERGHLHLVPEFIRKIEEVFGRMGFDVAEGPEIETEAMNFDLLNFAKEHAARDTQGIFYLKLPPEDGSKMLLRGHTSPVQIRYMQSHKPPFRAIFPGRTYRKDDDATHSPMFHQFEGLMIGEDVSLANMKAVIITFLRELISPTAEFRFRTGFFPFVEPGLEVDMSWQGDESASREGKWLEMGGCGMVHPNVLKNCGIDQKKWQGFAFGFGVERMIMIKHQIPDLRTFYESDLRFLRQF